MRVILCTAPVELAETLARGLVESRVVACVNVVPRVRSVYRWKGEIEEEDEALLVMKTTAERVESVIDRVRRAHPYDVPEVVSLAIDDGLPEYLAWLAEQVREP